jgi:hypothetical protein
MDPRVIAILPELSQLNYMGDSVKRSQMDIKHVIFKPGKTFIS